MSPISPYLDIPPMRIAIPASPTTSAALGVTSPTSPESAYVPPNAPLILPRLDSGHYEYGGGQGTTLFSDDFQSNALEIDTADTSPLAGLGIHCPPVPSAADSAYEYDSLYPHWNAPPDNLPLPLSPGSLPLPFSDLLCNHVPLAPSSLEFPWSMDSTLSSSNPSEFSSNASCRLDKTTRESSVQPAEPVTTDSELADSLRQLTALSGLTIEEFVAQLEATASLNLDVPEPRFGPERALDVSTDNLELEAHLQHWPSFESPEMPLALVDISLRVPLTTVSIEGSGFPGVNPVDVMPYCPSPIAPIQEYSPLVYEFDDELDNPFSQDDELPPSLPACTPEVEYVPMVPLHESHIPVVHPNPVGGSGTPSLPPLLLPASGPEPEFATSLIPSLSPAVYQSPSHYPGPPSEYHGSDDDPLFESSSSSEYSPSLEDGERAYATRSTRKRKFGHVLTNHHTSTSSFNNGGHGGSSSMEHDYNDSPSSNHYNPFDLEVQGTDCQNLPEVNLGTPVLDAHRGVDIDDLKAKAERYRHRNQGRDYDKRWLLSFAGKLSARGELVEEFRCYVTGCRQTNKRRDHILIHVGAHLDQRPFKCPHCPARFLRKNECKRHELSHTGIRPYTCPLCPAPGTTFVRQDLLKRHMKRTHRIPTPSPPKKEEKEATTSSRPRKRARTCS